MAPLKVLVALHKYEVRFRPTKNGELECLIEGSFGRATGKSPSCNPLEGLEQAKLDLADKLEHRAKGDLQARSQTESHLIIDAD